MFPKDRNKDQMSFVFAFPKLGKRTWDGGVAGAHNSYKVGLGDPKKKELCHKNSKRL